jgi:hypothetical protein
MASRASTVATPWNGLRDKCILTGTRWEPRLALMRISAWSLLKTTTKNILFFKHVAFLTFQAIPSMDFWVQNWFMSCMLWSESESYVTTDGQPDGLGIKHPFGAYDQIFITCVTVMVLFLWGALSDERMGLSFVYAAGHCQRSLSLVRVPWDSRPYFTVSDLRLPFSSPPTTRRVTVEVFDPASTWVVCFGFCPLV